jgi:hypothetical protein
MIKNDISITIYGKTEPIIMKRQLPACLRDVPRHPEERSVSKESGTPQTDGRNGQPQTVACFVRL